MKKKAVKEKFNKKLFFLFVILIIAIILLLVLKVKDKDPQTSQIKYPSATINGASPIKEGRINYNFEKIQEEKFLTFENKEIGFSIDYPSEVNPHVYSETETKEKFTFPALQGPVWAANFSLISQPPGAYEIFDGLVFHIVYYKNIWGQNFENHILQMGKDYDSQTKAGTRFDGTINFNGNKGLKLVSCCYAGETIAYYFPSKDNRYFIEVTIFSVGEDREKFDQVADKMINSLKIY